MKKFIIMSLAIAMVAAAAGVAVPKAASAQCTFTGNYMDDGVIICSVVNPNNNGTPTRRTRINNSSFVSSFTSVSANAGGQGVFSGEDAVGITINPGNATVNAWGAIVSGNVFYRNPMTFNGQVFPF